MAWTRSRASIDEVTEPGVLFPRSFLSSICVGTHVQLELESDPTVDPATMRTRGERCVLHVEGPLTLTTEGGTIQLSCHDPGGLGPLLTLRMTWVADVTERLGALHVRFESGAEIAVPPGARFEAWSVQGPGTRLLVSLPGGEIATFG